MFFENFNLTVNIFQKLMHKNTWESHFLKIFKKCEVFFTQKVVFFQVFGWCFGLVFLGFELVFWAHDVLATLTVSSFLEGSRVSQLISLRLATFSFKYNTQCGQNIMHPKHQPKAQKHQPKTPPKNLKKHHFLGKKHHTFFKNL